MNTTTRKSYSTSCLRTRVINLPVAYRYVCYSNYMNRKWDTDNEELRRKCIDEVIARVDEIGDSPVGIIAAQDIIDIVTENLAPEIYNKGVRDAKKLMTDKLSSLESDIDLLEVRD